MAVPTNTYTIREEDARRCNDHYACDCYQYVVSLLHSLGLSDPAQQLTSYIDEYGISGARRQFERLITQKSRLR